MEEIGHESAKKDGEKVASGAIQEFNGILFNKRCSHAYYMPGVGLSALELPTSFSPYNNPMKYVLSCPFYRQGDPKHVEAKKPVQEASQNLYEGVTTG